MEKVALVTGSSSGIGLETALALAEANGEMVNRVANPNCIGNVPNYNGGGVDVYRTFNVGALDLSLIHI